MVIGGDRRTKPLVLHVGVHTTAAPVRRLMMGNRRALETQRIDFFPRFEVASRAGWGGELFDRPELLTNHLQSFWADSTYEALVVSHEDVIGPAFGGNRGPIYPRARESLRRLRTITGPGQVVLGLRPQHEFLESCYLQLIDDGGSYPFAEWLAAIDLTQLSWQPLVDAADDAYGPENVTLLDFGLAQQGQPLFLRNFLESLAIDVDIDVDIDTVPSNDGGVSDKGLRMALAVNHNLDDPRSARTVGRFLQERFSDLDYPPASLLDAGVKHEVRERYGHEYRALVTRDGAQPMHSVGSAGKA